MTGDFSAVNAPIFNGHTLRPIYGAGQMTLQVADAGNVVQAASFLTTIPGGTGNFTQPASRAWLQQHWRDSLFMALVLAASKAFTES